MAWQGNSMAGEQHGRGTALQENGMAADGMAGERHGNVMDATWRV
jgi:hypothetical protein